MGGIGASPGPGGEFGDLSNPGFSSSLQPSTFPWGPSHHLNGFSGFSNDQGHRENHSFCLDQNRSQIPTNGGPFQEDYFQIGAWEGQWWCRAGAGSGVGCGLPDSPFTKW